MDQPWSSTHSNEGGLRLCKAQDPCGRTSVVPRLSKGRAAGRLSCPCLTRADRDLDAHARSGRRRRLRDVRARALQGARPRRRARVPRVRARRSPRTPADGLPTTVVPEYRASRSTAGRIAAMASRGCAAGADPQALRRPRRDPLPALGDVASGGHTAGCDHRARRAARGLSGVLLARRARLPAPRLRLDGQAQPHRDHDLRARTAGADRATRPGSRPRRRDLPRRRPRAFTPGDAPRHAEPFLLYPANAWPHKNHARLFEAFARVRAERPELRLVLTGAAHDRLSLPEGVESRGHVSLDELVALYRTAAALVYPEPVRRLRHPVRRGDGLRLPGGRVERRLPPGGLRRRRRLLRPARPRVDRRRDPPACSTHRRRAATGAGSALHLGALRPRARRRLRASSPRADRATARGPRRRAG